MNGFPQKYISIFNSLTFHLSAIGSLQLQSNSCQNSWTFIQPQHNMSIKAAIKAVN